MALRFGSNLVTSIFEVSGYITNYLLYGEQRLDRYISEANAALRHPFAERVNRAHLLSFDPADRTQELDTEILSIEQSMEGLQKQHQKASLARYLISAILSPIHKLPFELLSTIFALALPEFGHTCGSSRASQWHQEFTTVMTLRLVCVDWNQIVLSNKGFFTKVGLAFFTKPIPEGPWKTEKSKPWNYFEPKMFRFSCSTVEVMDGCVPYESGPADNYNLSLSSSAAAHALLSQAGGQLLIDIDMRCIPDRSSTKEAVVSLAQWHSVWGTYLCDDFSPDVLGLLDTMANNDIDIAEPFVEFGDLRAYSERYDFRESIRAEGMDIPNSFSSLHTLYLRDSRFRTDKYSFTDFFRNLKALRHLSINDIFYWTSTDLTSPRLPFGQLETLELLNIRSYKFYVYILGATPNLENLIITVDAGGMAPLGYIELARVSITLHKVRNLVYENKGDMALLFLRHFHFPAVQKLSLSGICVLARSWLTSKEAQDFVLSAMFGAESEYSMPQLSVLELLHLERADFGGLISDCLNFSKGSQKDTTGVDRDFTFLDQFDCEPVATRFLIYSKKERRPFPV